MIDRELLRYPDLLRGRSQRCSRVEIWLLGEILLYQRRFRKTTIAPVHKSLIAAREYMELGALVADRFGRRDHT